VLVSVPTASIDQNLSMSGSPGSTVVIEVIWRRADEVASDIVVGNGPDRK